MGDAFKPLAVDGKDAVPFLNSAVAVGNTAGNHFVDLFKYNSIFVFILYSISRAQLPLVILCK